MEPRQTASFGARNASRRERHAWTRSGHTSPNREHHVTEYAGAEQVSVRARRAGSAQEARGNDARSHLIAAESGGKASRELSSRCVVSSSSFPASRFFLILCGQKALENGAQKALKHGGGCPGASEELLGELTAIIDCTAGQCKCCMSFGCPWD